MSRMVIFDDRDWPPDEQRGANLGPMTDLRAAFELRTGMLTTQQRLLRDWADGLACVRVPPMLEEIVRERSECLVNRLPEGESFLCVSGRWAYPATTFELTVGQALIETDTGDIVAAELSHHDASALLEGGSLPGTVQRIEFDGRLLVRRPWEVLALLPKTLLSDLMDHPLMRLRVASTEAAAAPAGVTVLGDEPVAIHPGASVLPTVVLDAERGPILIDARATIRPGSIIIGPAYIGEDSTVLDQALIKANTVIGPNCKVAGEIGATIFQGCANKAHEGYLGDSFVGEWVNLGAGTTASNLLNTYGEILMRVQPDLPLESTGMMYLGAIIGDHVKTAIGTRLMTGTVIGTGAMIAGTAPPPTCVRRFAWITDKGGREYLLNKFIEVARTVMARRGVEMTDAMVHTLERLHEGGDQ